MSVEAVRGDGTEVGAVFVTDHLGCHPLGALVRTITLLMTGNPDVNTVFSVSDGNDAFEISTAEVREIMGGVPIGLPRVSTLVREILEENISVILGTGA